MSTKVQKIMVQPINLIFKYFQNKSRVEIWLYEKTQFLIEGMILGFDEFMNLVLDDSEEVNIKTNERTKLGKLIISSYYVKSVRLKKFVWKLESGWIPQTMTMSTKDGWMKH